MYYSKLKIFYHREKLDSLSEGKITAPVHIRIKPTNMCNHNCYYCSYQNSYGQLGKDMVKHDFIPIEKMREIIDDCYDMGVKALTFSGGGEPLVHKDFEEMLYYIGGRMEVGLLTNGVLLKGSIAEAVANYTTWVRISMDGWDNESYKHYRNCGDKDFDALLDNLYKFNKKKCVLGVNIIVNELNAPHILDLVAIVSGLGVESIKVSPCIISNDSNVNNDYHFKIAPIVARELDYISVAGIEVYNSYHLQLEGFKKDYTWCPYIQIVPIIGADQNVYTCHDKAYNKDTGLLGSIKDKSFKEMWFDGKEKFYKINPSVNCNHHCVIDNGNRMLFEYLAVEHKEFA